MTTPTIQGQRDNLSIGIFLARHPYGAELDAILQLIGWDGSSQYRRSFVNRFRYAQAIGRDARHQRRSGYFSWNAQPFGTIFLYKATWYVWRNPESNIGQTVPLLSVDLKRMREFRDKYLATLTSTTRGIRTAHDLQELRDAEERDDNQAIDAIQARMLEDGGLGEILSGYHGLPYADMAEVLSELPDRLGGRRYQFQKTARKILHLESEIQKEQAKLSDQLSEWVKWQTGLPKDVQERALADAESRLTELRTM